MSGPEAAGLADLVERVREDSELTPAEKETSINFSKGDERARVFTAEAGLIRRFLQHSHFTPDTYTLIGGRSVESVEVLDRREGAIAGVTGTIPIGCLKFRSSRRSTNNHAPIITHTTTSSGRGDS